MKNNNANGSLPVHLSSSKHEGEPHTANERRKPEPDITGISPFFSYYTNGSNNFAVIDFIPADYPFPDVLKENEKGGCVWIENLKTWNKAPLPLARFLAKIEAGELTPVTE